MAYNTDVNYMTIIQDPNTSAADRAKAEASRNEKIAGMNAAGTNTGGYTATYNHGNAPAGYTGSVKSNTSVSAAAQKIIDQMNANSLKWYTDPANRSSYEQANQTLAQRLSSLKETDANGALVTYSANHNTASGEWAVTPNYAQATATDNVAGVTGKAATLSGLELGDKYGINYDQSAIQKLLDNTTKSEYALKNQQQIQTENKFYNTMLDTQGTALDSLRKSQASAVATGASRGMAAANELSAILNLQQTSADEATALAQSRNNLGAEEAAAYTKNASTALDTSNSLKQAIANLAITKYGYDTQGYAADLSYLAALADVAAQKYASNTTLEGVKYNADANVAAANATASKYGSSRNTYTGGTTGGGSTGKTPGTSGALDDLNTKIAANDNGWVPDGKKYTISNNGDGTYTLKGVTNTDGTTGNLTVDSNEMERIKNNGYDASAVTDPNYFVSTTKSNYDVGGVAGTKNWTEQQALDYMHTTGQLAPGWYVDPTAGPKYAQEATYVGEQTTNQYTLTGTQGQKIAVGVGNYATVWTYDAKAGVWKNSSGTSKNITDFKAYLAKQNQAYIKVLN